MVLTDDNIRKVYSLPSAKIHKARSILSEYTGRSSAARIRLAKALKIDAGLAYFVEWVIGGNSPQEEKVMLSSCLKSSDAKLPEIAKAKPKKPRAKKPAPESVSDELLVRSCDENVTGLFDGSFGQEPAESTETA